MRTVISVIVGIIISGNLMAQSRLGYKVDSSQEVEIEKTLQRMSLEEKVGQMLELSLDVLGTNDASGNFVLDREKCEKAFLKYKIGSVLNVPGTQIGPTAQTPEWFQKVIRQINALSIRGSGIPTVYGLDMNHGASYAVGATLFPQNINLGATFNPELARRAAEICAYETRATDCPWTYSPTIDLTRDPRWSRVWENFGEDALVNTQMGLAMVRGFQGNDPVHIDKFHVGTSLKHYMAYGAARTGKDRTPAYVPEWELRDKFFAPYKACVEAGATSVMVNSGSVNGVPMHVSYKYLTKWLKQETGWDGVIVTDWADIQNLWTREMVAKDRKEAIMMAINAGVDMSMDPYDLSFCDLLVELVREGKVSQERVDDACRRILRMKCRLGLMKNPDTNRNDYPKFGCAEFASVSQDAAAESMVLLKNHDCVLPLKQGRKILVCGPNANSMRCLNGGWSYTWQGKGADRFTKDKNTILEALRQRFGKENVVYEPLVEYDNEGSYWEEKPLEFSNSATQELKECDYIVACIGENSYAETPGNLDDLALSENQRNMVKELARLGKPIVLVINGGRPRLVADIEPLASAVVDILLPGNEGGNALAGLLAGDENFSGKLPYTYPRYNGSLTTYDYRVSEQTGSTMAGAYDYNACVDVQWPFGYGLSYTTFDYSNLRCDRREFGRDDMLTVTVDVKNTGSVRGKESVLLYSRDMVASIVPESRRLRAFRKIELQPGESKTVTFRLPATDLSFVGEDGDWLLEPGEFRLMVGSQTVSITCK